MNLPLWRELRLHHPVAPGVMTPEMLMTLIMLTVLIRRARAQTTPFPQKLEADVFAVSAAGRAISSA